MVRSAPRLDPRLVAAIAKLHDPRRPVAETNRMVGALAERLGISRPSYEQVRRQVAALAASTPSPTAMDAIPGVVDALLDIAFRTAPPEAILDVLSGDYRRPRKNK